MHNNSIGIWTLNFKVGEINRDLTVGHYILNTGERSFVDVEICLAVFEN